MTEITEAQGPNITASREIAAQVDDVFAAFSDPERMARWWGPADFTNTFHVFEFTNGGRWIYTMHGPDGREYPNESIFREIEAGRKIVIEHIVKPVYTLTITFAGRGRDMLISWEQSFENQVFATKMKDFLTSANEQNLDRLTAEVLGK